MGIQRHYPALLDVTDALVDYHNPSDLFPKLSHNLHVVTGMKFTVFSFHDPTGNVMRKQLWQDGNPVQSGIELPVDEAPSGWVWQNQMPLVIPDILTETRFREVLDGFAAQGMRGYCAVPLTTARGRLGALGLGSAAVAAYSKDDVEFLCQVGRLVALPAENSILHLGLQEERSRLQMLLQVNSALGSKLSLQELFPAICECLRKVVKQDFASLALHDESTQSLRMYALDFPRVPEPISPEALVPLRQGPAGRAFVEGEVKVFNGRDLAEMESGFLGRLSQEGMKSLCCIPLTARDGPIGTLNLASREENAFPPPQLELIQQVAAQAAIALDNARVYEEIVALRDQLAKEKLYLEDEIVSGLSFEEIVGESPGLKQVLAQATVVAPSEATVLILGETGTGKDLIAHAIHRMSTRKGANFVKLNCAAIPTGLLESELFGHEKGAFTGAITQKIGRLELADNGTLFLDEVGDIPLELQPKLLRILQDHEFERLGSTRTIHVNIRLIAATNRDLARSVAEHEFRSDLFYRLSVFPLRLPPLCKRGGDIPLLVRYFVQKFSRRMGKQIESIPTETMNALVNWPWPGNVRELESFLERSVILSSGPVLKAPIGELYAARGPSAKNGTLETIEREYVLRVLRESHGVISGPKGAAARLGLKRTTLQSRIRKLGIARPEYKD